MGLLQDTIDDLWQRYLHQFNHGDPRTADWLLMGAYYPTFVLTGIYLAIVWLGPKFMKNRAPLTSRWPVFIYNIILVVLSIHIFKEILIGTWRARYSYTCQPVLYTYDENEMRIAGAVWWFYFTKLIEFADTFLFILRKKNNQVTFLHVYHHATIFPIWWIGVKWAAGGQSFFYVFMNSGVHILMYTYYGISALGPEYQKYLWWKKYLTRMQVMQFVAAVWHSLQSVCFNCDFSAGLEFAAFVYNLSLFALFVNFYIKSYRKKAKTRGDLNSNFEKHHLYSKLPTPNGDRKSR